jgi:hypothetical protein
MVPSSDGTVPYYRTVTVKRIDFGAKQVVLHDKISNFEHKLQNKHHVIETRLGNAKFRTVLYGTGTVPYRSAVTSESRRYGTGIASVRQRLKSSPTSCTAFYSK